MPRDQRPLANKHGHGIAVVVAAVYAADAANALPPDMPPPSVTSPITHPGPCGKPCSLDVGEQVRKHGFCRQRGSPEFASEACAVSELSC